MICYFFPDSSGGQDKVHTLNACWNRYNKGRFFSAKKQAMKTSGGWFRDQCACFTCFNPNSICKNRKRGICEFPDLVLPICWAAFHQKKQWVEQSLVLLTGGYVAADEQKYMSWLGGQQEVFGDAKASRAHAVADIVFQQMESEQRFW
jgi:hypothetical protein